MKETKADETVTISIIECLFDLLCLVLHHNVLQSTKTNPRQNLPSYLTETSSLLQRPPLVRITLHHWFTSFLSPAL